MSIGSASPPSRVVPVDVVRGLVMVLMALDHVRDWVTNVRFPPEDLSRASAALFATRWLTHFCAPTFFLLAGVGIGIVMERRGRAGLSRFLVTRGLWLLMLELVITPFGWEFGWPPVPAFALVLWALGWSMILMAALIHLPRRLVLALSLLVIFGHNLLDPIPAASLGAFAGIWHMVHVPGFLIPDVLFIAYPLIPWVAVMPLGSVLARVYGWEPHRRRALLIGCGIAAVVTFAVLRGWNLYGNPIPWVPQRTAALTAASVLNVLKYPPSLLFLLMTLGPALIALAVADDARGRFARWLAVYGRVPLFFYVVHIFVAHAHAVVLALVQGGEPRRIPVVSDPGSIPEWYGVPLPGVYIVWALVVAVLYYPCQWFGRLKARRSDWWIRYM